MIEPFPLSGRLAALLEHLPVEEFVFTPVPVKARRDGWHPARQHGFIVRLALCGCPATAARCVGMSRESAYRLRARPGAESFAAAWERALGWGESRQQDMALEQALCGGIKRVYYRGRKVDEYVVHDNRLLISLLGRLAARDRHAAPDPAEHFRRCLDAVAPEGGN
jgi:hypothetical protein